MKAVVSLSGGMDSATALAKAINESREVSAVGFSYGSKHNQYELASAREVAAHYNVQFDLVDLGSVGALLESDLLKSGGDVPESHYESEQMSRTVVPGRNMIFASILAGIAQSREAEEVWLGIHAGDHYIYPDCRPSFFYAMTMAIKAATGGRVQLKAPFLNETKLGILREGFRMGVPYELTRTCYKDQPVACGKCGACQERLEAFLAHDRKDPIEYE